MTASGTNHPVTDADWLPKLADEINAEHLKAMKATGEVFAAAGGYTAFAFKPLYCEGTTS